MSDASIATARVATAHANRYLQQLCKHWSHKLAVEFDPERGTVRFDRARCDFTATEDALLLRLEAEDGVLRLRMQDVIARHLERFAFREALAIDWVDAHA